MRLRLQLGGLSLQLGVFSFYCIQKKLQLGVFSFYCIQKKITYLTASFHRFWLLPKAMQWQLEPPEETCSLLFSLVCLHLFPNIIVPLKGKEVTRTTREVCEQVSSE